MPDPPNTPPAGLDAVSALSEPTRRALYEHVVSAGGWVSRDDAAGALGLERATAAHHLDRLAADGLLDVEYQRRSGRSGPGAGRPAKLYARARREIDVSLPPRRYELAGSLLADAIDRSRATSTDVVDALGDVARDEGARLAAAINAHMEAAADQAPAGAPPTDPLAAVIGALAEQGFEPRPQGDGSIVLHNCPYHQLARTHTELICGLNVAVLGAAIDGVGDTGVHAVLEPDDEHCCVTLRPT